MINLAFENNRVLISKLYGKIIFFSLYIFLINKEMCIWNVKDSERGVLMKK
jgi:hypothetical protein